MDTDGRPTIPDAPRSLHSVTHDDQVIARIDARADRIDRVLQSVLATQASIQATLTEHGKILRDIELSAVHSRIAYVLGYTFMSVAAMVSAFFFAADRGRVMGWW